MIEDWEALKAMLDWRPDEKRIVHWRLDEMLDDWDDEDDGEWDVHEGTSMFRFHLMLTQTSSQHQ